MTPRARCSSLVSETLFSVVRHIELNGTHQQMGESFGEAFRSDIAKFYELRLANVIRDADTYGGQKVTETDVLQMAGYCLEVVRRFAPLGLSELEGIARGADLSLTQIWAMNALTDLRDVMALGPHLRAVEAEGCSALLVAASHSATGAPVAAQTWDLATDNMPYVLTVQRTPSEGPKTLSLTTVGCLSLLGLNEHGIAVGTTNLRTTDVRIGVGYLDVIHRALMTCSSEEACSVIRDAPRAGAHFFYVLADEENKRIVRAFECSARQAVERIVSHGTYVHCNHVIESEIRPLELEGTPVASTHYRQERLEGLAKPYTSFDVSVLQDLLADTAGGVNAINRKDYGGISTNAAVVMEPRERRLWVVHGPPDEARWRETRLS